MSEFSGWNRPVFLRAFLFTFSTSTREIGYAVRAPGGAVHHFAESEIPMKKIAVRKAGTVRLTSAAASAYCCGTN
ncbi:hypothetical protein [Streptomyces sp. NPDC046985]|uniref:hypothetical protein n=1 Tax=Streptomyces sp. NPDC046985 TaxID=3155377 RepID=UPI0033E4EF2B